MKEFLFGRKKQKFILKKLKKAAIVKRLFLKEEVSTKCLRML